jgi:hypothetical protein
MHQGPLESPTREVDVLESKEARADGTSTMISPNLGIRTF